MDKKKKKITTNGEKSLIERNLSKCRNSFSAFMENLPVIAYVKDESLCHVYFNPTGCEFMGRSTARHDMNII